MGLLGNKQAKRIEKLKGARDQALNVFTKAKLDLIQANEDLGQENSKASIEINNLKELILEQEAHIKDCENACKANDVTIVKLDTILD